MLPSGQITIFYTEMLTRNVTLWSFSTSGKSEKIPQISNFQVIDNVKRNFFYTNNVTENKR